MREINYKRLTLMITVASIIFLLFSLLFLIMGIVSNNYFIEVFKFMITVTIAFISLYFGVRSVILSKQANILGEESKKIANDSDVKMQSLANYHLLEIKGIIEDLRLNLQKHRKKLSFMAETGEDYKVPFDEYHSDYSYSMWKCLEKLRQVQTILSYSTPNYQIQVIDYVNKFFEILRLGRDENHIELRDEDKIHIRLSYDIISSFPAFNQYTKRRELLELKENITS